MSTKICQCYHVAVSVPPFFDVRGDHSHLGAEEVISPHTSKRETKRALQQAADLPLDWNDLHSGGSWCALMWWCVTSPIHVARDHRDRDWLRLSSSLTGGQKSGLSCCCFKPGERTRGLLPASESQVRIHDGFGRVSMRIQSQFIQSWQPLWSEEKARDVLVIPEGFPQGSGSFLAPFTLRSGEMCPEQPAGVRVVPDGSRDILWLDRLASVKMPVSQCLSECFVIACFQQTTQQRIAVALIVARVEVQHGLEVRDGLLESAHFLPEERGQGRSRAQILPGAAPIPEVNAFCFSALFRKGIRAEFLCCQLHRSFVGCLCLWIPGFANSWNKK